MADLFSLNVFEEFELWLNSLLAHNRQPGIAFGSQKAIRLDRDFREEIRTTLQILHDLILMCQQISAAELRSIQKTEPSVPLDPDKDLRRQFRQYKGFARRIEEFVQFWDALESCRVLSLTLLRLPHLSRKEFKSFAFFLSEQINKFLKSGSAAYLKKKLYEWRFQHMLQRDILGHVDMEGIKEQMELVFLDFFQILSIVNYMDVQMRKEFKFRKLMMLFYYCYFRSRRLLKLLDETQKYHFLHHPELAEAVETTMLALKMENRRIFNGELRDLESKERIDIIYGQMQNALGLTQNALQQSFISIVHLLNPGFDEFEVFENLPRRYRESVILLNDLEQLHQTLQGEEEQLVSSWPEVRAQVDHFRNTSMKFLFFRDWNSFEEFCDEIDSCAPRERVFIIHRFQIYISTLIGEVRKRAVLGKCKPASAEGFSEFGA